MLVACIEGVRLSDLTSFEFFMSVVFLIVNLEIISELTVMTYWNVTSCNQIEAYRRFEGT